MILPNQNVKQVKKTKPENALTNFNAQIKRFKHFSTQRM